MLPAIPLAVVTVALGGYVAYTNWKEGWMPTRKNVSSALRGLMTEMTVEARAPQDAQPVWYAGMIVEPAEFAQQLANLQMSLQRANAPVVRHAVATADVPQAVTR